MSTSKLRKGVLPIDSATRPIYVCFECGMQTTLSFTCDNNRLACGSKPGLS